jgi:hypothetical protein
MSLLSRATYRSRQFAGALRAHLHESERAEARGALGEHLLPLFESMAPRDQRHCFDVYLALKAGGCRDRGLLVAALLHDAGKGSMAGGPVRLWHRVAYVLLAAAAPGALGRLAAGGRGGLAALYHHAEKGATLAASLGAPADVVETIRRHEERGHGDERLRLLRAADDAC